VQAHGYEFPSDAGPFFEKDIKIPHKIATVYPHQDFDPRLRRDSPAIDKGKPFPAINDGFRGKAPDLGAFELGDELPRYGPRPYVGMSPPCIVGFKAPEIVKAGDPFPVTGVSVWKVDKAAGLEGRILYRAKGGADFKNAPMKAGEGGNLSGQVPGSATGGPLEYYLAVTERGRKTFTKPAGGPAKPWPVVPDKTAPTRVKNLKMTQNRSYRVAIAWDAAEDDKGIAAYRVFKGDRPGFALEGEGHRLGARQRSWIDAAPVPARSVSYAVRAEDRVGRMGEAAYLEIKVPPDQPPENTMKVGTRPGAKAVLVSWKGDMELDVEKLVVLRGEGKGGGMAEVHELDPRKARSWLNTGLEPGKAYRFAVKLKDQAGLVSPASKAAVGKPLGFVRRINCGGHEVPSVDGAPWEADRGRIPSSLTYKSKGIINNVSPDLQAVYLNERFAFKSFAYTFKVKPGPYVVVLHFAETHDQFGVEGKRKFKIVLNGKTVRERMDIVAAAGGPFEACKVRSQTTVGKDGVLKLELARNPAGPCIAGVEIMEMLKGKGKE
jgi:hypothetical protein